MMKILTNKKINFFMLNFKIWKKYIFYLVKNKKIIIIIMKIIIIIILKINNEKSDENK